jgi:hypothetical protein
MPCRPRARPGQNPGPALTHTSFGLLASVYVCSLRSISGIMKTNCTFVNGRVANDSRFSTVRCQLRRCAAECGSSCVTADLSAAVQLLCPASYTDTDCSNCVCCQQWLVLALCVCCVHLRVFHSPTPYLSLPHESRVMVNFIQHGLCLGVVLLLLVLIRLPWQWRLFQL